MVDSIVKNKIKGHKLGLQILSWKDGFVDPICDMIVGIEFLEHLILKTGFHDCEVSAYTKLFKKLRDLNSNSTSNSNKSLITNKDGDDHDNGIKLIINRLKKIELNVDMKADKYGINDLNDIMTTLFAFVNEMDHQVYVMAKVTSRSGIFATGIKFDENNLAQFKILWDNVFSVVIEQGIPVNNVFTMYNPDNVDIDKVVIPTFKEKLSSTRYIQPRSMQ